MPREELNEPQVVAEIRTIFLDYEAALLANDIAALNNYFWISPQTVRYGVAEQCYGHEAISEYRSQAAPVSRQRKLRNTVITTFGRDLACISTEFYVPGQNELGRQTQTWLRMPAGWRIVNAHVSAVVGGE